LQRAIFSSSQPIPARIWSRTWDCMRAADDDRGEQAIRTGSARQPVRFIWVERFLFARRIGSVDADDDDPDRRDERTEAPRRPSSDRRRAAVRVLEQVAGALLRRPRR
jgi:hypothetical protein